VGDAKNCLELRKTTMEERWILPDSIGESIQTPGMDYGPKGLTFAFRYLNCIVAKQPGMKAFMSRGVQVYYPALWRVVRMLGAGSNRGGGLARGVNVETLCTLLVAPAPSQSLQEAVKVCRKPDTAKYWRDRCKRCGEYRGEHRRGVECAYDAAMIRIKDPNMTFQKIRRMIP
jgi:hypothetical protein